MNQIILGKTFLDVITARTLVNIYFLIFDYLIKMDEKENKPSSDPVEAGHGVETKMMAALLTGINRAFPYASIKLEEDALPPQNLDAATKRFLGENILETVYEKHLSNLFRITHLPKMSITTSVQALQLVFQLIYRPTPQNDESGVDDSVAIYQPKLAQRYYRALYAQYLLS
jgi:hypothetical protein